MAKEKTYTPMMQHYLSVKKQYPDALVFYRIGDFYEMFFEDAKIASKELDLILTGKSAGVEDKVPMCGVPHHAVQSYLQRLVARGYKIAIVEQMQDPKEAVGLVERDVIRVITPGTVMDEITDEKASVYLAAVNDHGYGYSLAFTEMSTGENFVEDVDHKDNTLIQTILKNNVREIVVHKGFREKIIQMLREMHVVISYCEDDTIKEEYLPLAEKITKEYDRSAYGMMLNYLEATQKHMLAHLQTAVYNQEDETLYMDYSTRQNLELTIPLHENGKAITLWSFLDTCRSAMGSRQLRKWIERPLINKAQIEKRYDRTEWLMKNFMDRQAVRDAMSNVYDLQRLIARCAMNTANAVDCQRLVKTLAEVPTILTHLQSDEFSAYTAMDPLNDLYQELKDAFVEDPPLLVSDGGMFKDGYDQELDEARTIQKGGRDFIANMEIREKEKTGIKTLKIGYNKIFGYYIEISKAAAKEVKPEWGYIRKQTLTNNERFISPELKEKEDAILHAEENAIRIEKQLFQKILDRIKGYLPKLQKMARALAEIDCYAALAEASSRYGYVRPVFTEDELDIENGRHPILDEMMKDPKYVANSVKMDHDSSILLITGPNMGGKSTYMRQTALLVVMAQIGCFVPAKSCRMPIFDKIFTRIGASDDILSGQSTFMVEMSEANRALQDATDHSLILFDEIGRGTSTYDGMALAQAMIEYIASCLHAKTMFSTHYHELTALSDNVPGVRNVHVAVKADDEKVTFLYKIKDGAAGRSFGINVARLAGLPDSVLDRAKDLQNELESRKRVVQQNFQVVEMKKEDAQADALKEKLLMVSPDDLSPHQAWEMLNDLYTEAKKK
ncbi:MAG: DNA mismatch repair protein MutS [Solobacterium sp.]|jgi:DNA mismatch repair protein MutS|nr:DNA mismatch repair protein MutS [Solobacterium sp.]MCH4227474.1 DNA mismatch repair protein MutS [Solobacterium sp.]MCH4282898.1 DNA mismatch repair protein MutS [Solobacterium sp.]